VGRSERRYGYFYREIVLPDGVDTKRVRAEFENGMLRVTIPVLTNRRELPINDTSHSEMAPRRSTTKKSGIIITTKVLLRDAA
jgi:hypothetical protein